jgi:hypothetical protein
MKNLFLSVGAMKAGTTLLFNILKQHPDIYCTPEKELHYFAHKYGLDSELTLPLIPRYPILSKNKLFSFTSNDINKKMRGAILTNDFRLHRLASVMRGRYSKIRNADKLREIVLWYTDRYLTEPVDEAWFDKVFQGCGERYCTDFSNYNSLLGRDSWERIRRETTGKLRVLYVLRHPVERLWSHYKFHSEQSNNDHALEHLTERDVDALVRNDIISPHSKYGGIVKNLKDCLDDDELHIMFFEDLIEYPESSLIAIQKFLGVKDYKYVFDISRKVNPSKKSTLSDKVRTRMMTYLKPQIDMLVKLGVNVPDYYYRACA